MSDPKKPGRPVTVEIGGGTITAPNEEVARRAVADYRAGVDREARKRELWGDGDGRARMVRLSERFPSLAMVAGAGIGPWDELSVLAYACRPVSHGERLAALFVLHVWNSGTDWNEIAHMEGDDGEPPLLEEGESIKAFDLMEAWAVWDLEHRYAALLWLTDPFWP